MPEIDWRSASREERQILYRYLKAEMDTRNMTLFELLEEALGTANVGQGYDANMRSGRFNRKHAFQFYDWLKVNNRGRADSVLEAVLFMRQQTAEGAWGNLVRHNTGGLQVIEHPERQQIVTFAEADRIRQKMARGTPFFIRLHSWFDGYAIGFQQSQMLWYPLPLSREPGWISISEGGNDLPRRADGTIEPLTEEVELGVVRFVIVTAKEKAGLDEMLNATAPLTRQQLDKFAHEIDQNPPPIVCSVRILITQ